MDLIVYEPGRPLPPRVLRSVRELFLVSYHRYHYLSELGDPGRLKVLAAAGGELLGYASARLESGYAYLANLLVREDRRGSGVGRALERVRFDWVRSAGAHPYVSCACEDGSSQRLKLELSLEPVAFKVGYRKDVARSGSRGSAVVFTDGVPGPDTPRRDWCLRGAAGRVRHIMRHPERALHWLCDDGRDDEQYVDILTGPAGALALAGRPEVRFAGLDRDRGSAAWHYCFQVSNSAYREGRNGRPTVVRMPSLSGIDVPVLEVTA